MVSLLPYSTQKSATLQTGKITAVDSIGNNSFYYTLEMKTTDKIVSCPIMNANGEVLGLIQKSSSDKEKESYAIGATYGAALSITPFSLNDRSLQSIPIKKGLPDTEEQATVYLFMASSIMNADDYAQLLNDLRANPFLGTDLGRHLRKVRMSITSKGKGKSGGARVITYTVILAETDTEIKLLTIYDKSERENLTDKELIDLMLKNGL